MIKHRSLSGTTIVLLFTWLVPLLDGAPGDLDPTFGTGGKVRFGFGGGDDQGAAVAVQTDGKTVVAGTSYDVGEPNFSVLRYNPDGSLDSSFDGDGKASNAHYGIARAMKIQSDGKIVVAGSDGTNFLVARFNADGSVDSTFGTGGIVTTPIGSITSEANALAIQPDNKIVAAGYAAVPSTFDFRNVVALARYNPDGSLDSTFDGDGIVTSSNIGSSFDSGSAAYGLILSGSTIVVAGVSADTFTVFRYNANGSLDTTFNNGQGYVATALGGNSLARAVAIQPARPGVSETTIVAAGYVVTGSGNRDFALVRYFLDGTRDTSFDGDGIVISSISPSDDVINALAIQNTGTALSPV